MCRAPFNEIDNKTHFKKNLQVPRSREPTHVSRQATKKKTKNPNPEFFCLKY